MLVRSYALKIFVGILLFFVGVISLFWQDYKTAGNFFILKENISPIMIQSSLNKKITKISPISVTFISDENNLGAIGIRFNNYGQVSSDKVFFKLIYNNALYYQHVYLAKEFSGLRIFPFGFVPISQSKGKHITFKLISLYGDSTNAVSLENQKPIFVANYTFSRTYLLHNKLEIFSFLIKKFVYLLTDIQNYPLIFFLFSPFLFYLFTIIFFKDRFIFVWRYISKEIKNVKQYILKQNKIQNSKKTSLGKTMFSFTYMVVKISLIFFLIVILIICIDSFFLLEYFQLYIPLVVFLWITMFYVHKLDYRMSFWIAAFLLILCIVFFNYHDGVTVKKLSFWAYLFIWFGLIHTIILLVRKKI